MTKARVTHRVLYLVLFVFFATSGWAAVRAETKFSEYLSFDQTELRLHGVAILRWARLFDAYAGALYLPPGQKGHQWSEDLPKRLELVYFRSFTAEDFVNSSDKLLRRNLSSADYQRLSSRLESFYRLFRNVEPGDRYSLTYLPGQGTQLWLNDELLGQVPDADFAVAYFGLWLGDRPISKTFRDHLLQGHRP